MKRGLAIAAVLLFVAAGIAALTPISTANGISCGSWISRDSSDAESEDSSNEFANAILGRATTDFERTATQAKCTDAIGARTPIVIVLGVLAIASALGALIVSQQSSSRPPERQT